MRRLLILSILLVAAVSVNLKISPMKKVEELKNTKFGRTLLQLISLHSQVRGPIEELLEAIEDLVSDINENLEELDFNFQVRTNDHNSLVSALEQEVQDASQDIARMEDVIQNLLLPRRGQIQNKLQQVNDYMEYNRKTREESIHLREQEHLDYIRQVEEDNEALDAVDDALNLLASLTSPTLSLLQLHQLKFHFKQIPAPSWVRVQQGPMLRALIQLAAQSNFSDQSIVKEIVDALNEFRNQVVEQLNDMTKREAELEVEQAERLVQLDEEYSEFQKQIIQFNVELAATNQKIDDCTAFLNQRRSDYQQYESQLNLENETFAVETDIYQTARNDLTRELGVAEQGLSLIKSADFSDIKI